MKAERTNESYDERVAQGDTVALKLLLAESDTRLRRRLTGRIPANFRAVIEIDDVIQDAHVQVFRSLAQFRVGKTDGFFRWVAAIAQNELRAAIRRHRSVKRGGGLRIVHGHQPAFDDSAVELFEVLAGPLKTPSRCAARVEAIGAVEQAIAELPAMYGLAIRLVYLEGRSFRDAAAVLDRTERAVQGLCRRGMARLRASLKDASRFLSSTG